MIESIVADKDYVRKKTKLQLEHFWGYYLSKNRVEWTERTKLLISSCITIPGSTAAVERLFSHLNLVKDKRKFWLSPKHVDDRLRIVMNLPNDFRRFSTMKYTKIFLQTHRRADEVDDDKDESERSNVYVQPTIF